MHLAGTVDCHCLHAPSRHRGHRRSRPAAVVHGGRGHQHDAVRQTRARVCVFVASDRAAACTLNIMVRAVGVLGAGLVVEVLGVAAGLVGVAPLYFESLRTTGAPAVAIVASTAF